MSELGNRAFKAQEITTDGSWPRLELTSIEGSNVIKVNAQYKQQYRGPSSKKRIAKAKEAAGTIDNVVLTFPTKFDPLLLAEVMQYDPDNCYPYVVVCPVEQKADVELAAGDFVNRVLVNPTIDQLLYASSVGKGFSKGARGKTSGSLDKVIVAILQAHIHKNISSTIKFYKPMEEGITNEDARAEDELRRNLFSAEGKAISNLVNMTERFAMIDGKAHSSQGDLYDLFWSLPGTEIRWLDNLNKAPRHHAKAYVEFSPDDQKLILAGDMATVLDKKVFVPVDERDLKNLNIKEKGTLGDYVISTIMRRL